MAKCKATTQDGRPCDANAGESGFCFFHDPDQADANREAKSKGGAAGRPTTLQVVKPWRGNEGDLVILKSPTSEEVVSLICDTIDEVKTGRIDPKVANAVGYLSGVLLKALEYDALNERLQAIEEALALNEKGRQ